MLDPKLEAAVGVAALRKLAAVQQPQSAAQAPSSPVTMPQNPSMGAPSAQTMPRMENSAPGQPMTMAGNANAMQAQQARIAQQEKEKEAFEQQTEQTNAAAERLKLKGKAAQNVAKAQKEFIKANQLQNEVRDMNEQRVAEARQQSMDTNWMLSAPGSN